MLSARQENTRKQDSWKRLKAKADDGKRLQHAIMMISDLSTRPRWLQELDKLEKELEEVRGKKPTRKAAASSVVRSEVEDC